MSSTQLIAVQHIQYEPVFDTNTNQYADKSPWKDINGIVTHTRVRAKPVLHSHAPEASKVMSKVDVTKIGFLNTMQNKNLLHQWKRLTKYGRDD